ncbi:hypothetical protein [Desulfurobacterium sp.]
MRKEVRKTESVADVEFVLEIDDAFIEELMREIDDCFINLE